MKVVIADILSNTIDGKQTGHYFAVARNYQKLFGDNCVVAGGPVYLKEFSEEELMVLPYNNVEGDGLFKLRLRTFSNAKCLFRGTAGDVIVLQQCTTITSFLCLLFFYHGKSKVFYIQYNNAGLRQILGRLLFQLVKRKIDGIICPNDKVGEAYNLPYCVVPDYIYTGKNKVEKIPYTEKKYDFCMIGRISEEKGILEVAKHFVGKSNRVLIAGRPITEQLKTDLIQICSNATNIDLRLGFISDYEYKRFLNESRYTILNYQGEYSKRSSGVVYDTLFAGVPVIGCKCEALQFIEDNKMGLLYNCIEDIDFNSMLDNYRYEEYVGNIELYRQTHRQYKKILQNFLYH